MYIAINQISSEFNVNDKCIHHMCSGQIRQLCQINFNLDL